MVEPVLAPSVIAADWSDLARAARMASSGGADWLHLDVMDGHFVPNLTFGPDLVASLHGVSDLPLDVHLMVSQPEHWLERFAQAGAHILTIHAEATDHAQRLLARARNLGCRAGLALNPATSETVCDYLWDDLDLVLVMTVNPGASGQPFLPGVLPKLQRLRERAGKLGWDGRIEVDGGIGAETARRCLAAGADAFVAGKAVYGELDPAKAIRDLRAALSGTGGAAWA